MKKLSVLFMVLIMLLCLTSCVFNSVNTSRVMTYSYDSIQEIKILSSQNSGSVTLNDEHKQYFYDKAKELDFILNYSEEEIAYDYMFVITHTQTIFKSQEVFVLYDGIFYNEYGKRTQDLNAEFASQIAVIFEQEYQNMISEV